MGELRQPAFLLLFGPARPDAGDRERHRLDAHRDPGAAPAQLLMGDQLGRKVESLPAVLLGDERGWAQTEAVRSRDDLVRKLLCLVEMRRDRADLFLGELVRKVADLLLLGREGEAQCHAPYSATDLVSTARPRWLTALTSSLPSPAGSALTVTASPGTTTPANRTARRRRRCVPPTASAATVAAMPICSMPCAMRPGSPTERATSSSRWIGFMSPDASA